MGHPRSGPLQSPPQEPAIPNLPTPARTRKPRSQRPRALTLALLVAAGPAFAQPSPEIQPETVPPAEQPDDPSGVPTDGPAGAPAGAQPDAPVAFEDLPPGPQRDDQILSWSRTWSRLGAAQVDRLLVIAADETDTAEIRAAALIAAGRHGSLAAAESLFDLARDPSADPVLASSAYEALALLAGRADLGRDPEAWAGWLAESRAWTTQEWEWIRIERFRRAAQSAQATATEAERLAAETARRLFIGSSSDRRPDLLAELLNSPLPLVYNLGLDLASRELAEARPIGNGAARVAIGRLGVAQAEERARLVSLLDASGRPDAIEALRARLTDEGDVRVVEPLLRAAARRPASVTVGPSIRWLERTTGGLDAASVSITAHVRAGLLGQPDLERVRAVLAGIDTADLSAELAGLAVLTAPEPWLDAVHALLFLPNVAVRDTAALLVADRLMGEGRASELEVLAADAGLAEDVRVRLRAALPMEDEAAPIGQLTDPAPEQPAADESGADEPGTGEAPNPIEADPAPTDPER